MNNKKKNNSTKKEWIKYGIFAIVVITLYATGLHTEVISFAQRGLLATGLMNPDVTQITRSRTSEGNDAVTSDSNPSKVDFNLKLTDQDGNARSLKEFKGKVIFLNYWETGAFLFCSMLREFYLVVEFYLENIRKSSGISVLNGNLIAL